MLANGLGDVILELLKWSELIILIQSVFQNAVEHLKTYMKTSKSFTVIVRAENF